MGSLPYPVYDADNHLYEPPEAFLRHLPRRYAHEFQYVQVNGRTKIAIGGVISDFIPNPTFEVVAAPGVHERWYRAQPRLQLLDEQGLDGALIVPTLASAIEERLKHKPQVIAALFHALNQWLAEEWGFARDNRLFTVPFINLADVGGAVQELRNVLTHGARVIGIRPAPVTDGHGGSRSPGFEEFEPFWAQVDEAGIFVVLHSSDTGYAALGNMWKGIHQEYRPFEQQPSPPMPVNNMERAIADTISALICHGVFERHRNVRVASLENSARWIQPAYETWQRVYGQQPQYFRRDPIEQFHEHVFVAPSYEDDIHRVREYVPVSRILFGSDYPHPEGLAHPLDYLREIEDLDEVSRARIMGGNLRDLLDGVRN